MLLVWKIYVPCIMSGQRIPFSHHKDWDRKVREITGGLTIEKPARGEWLSPYGKLYSEYVIPVIIACSSENIGRIALLTLEHYNQEAVLYYLVSSEVHVIHRTKPVEKGA